MPSQYCRNINLDNVLSRSGNKHHSSRADLEIPAENGCELWPLLCYSPGRIKFRMTDVLPRNDRGPWCRLSDAMIKTIPLSISERITLLARALSVQQTNKLSAPSPLHALSASSIKYCFSNPGCPPNIDWRWPFIVLPIQVRISVTTRVFTSLMVFSRFFRLHCCQPTGRRELRHGLGISVRLQVVD